jgi:hypothetical protein
VNKTDLIKKLVKIAKKDFNVTVKKCMYSEIKYGYTSLEDQIVYINYSISVPQLISTVFHEIGHVLNIREGKFPIYHNFKIWFKHHKTKNFPAGFKRTALSAELYTEARGRVMAKTYFPKVRYSTTYTRSQVSLNKVRKIWKKN